MKSWLQRRVMRRLIVPRQSDVKWGELNFGEVIYRIRQAAELLIFPVVYHLYKDEPASNDFH